MINQLINNKILKILNYFTVKFLICLIIKELSILKRKVDYLKFFFKEIHLLKYLIYIFDEKTFPFKSKELLNFIKVNKKKWLKKDNKNKKCVLIECFINQQFYQINNIIVGKYLEEIDNRNAIALLRKGDIRSKFIFKSFGIENIIYYEYGNLFVRSFYLLKALSIIVKLKSIKEFINLRIRGIDIGLLSYDTFLRYTRLPTTDKFNFKMIIFFAEALFALSFTEKMLSNSKITDLVQSEKQFIPLNIIFQKFLSSRKRRVYARVGTDRLCVRIYSNFNQRHENKARYSKNILNFLFKKKKKILNKKINNFFKFQFKSKLYGKTWSTLVLNDKKTLSKWKKNWEKNLLSNQGFDYIKYRAFSKKQFCKKYNLEENKKIVTIFLPHLIDGNFQHGRKNLYQDNFSWAVNTIKIIQHIKSINWIIRDHPQEKRYNTISNFPDFLNEVTTNYPHIILCPKEIDTHSLSQITDISLTSHGTAGLEYQSFGKSSLVSENSMYNHFGFNKPPKKIFYYKKMLTNIDNLKKPSPKQILKAKTFLYLNYFASKTECSFIPKNLPRFESRMNYEDRNEFWRQLKFKNDKYQIKKDPFFKSFKFQILLKNRHTINFEEIKNKPVKFFDLNE